MAEHATDSGTDQHSGSAAEAAVLLDGLYEHSPWIARPRWRTGPFARCRTSSTVMAQVVRDAAAMAVDPDPRPPRAGRQGDGEQHAHGRVHQRAKQGGPDPLHARRICAHPAAQCRLQRASSAFRSFWRCADPAGTGLHKQEIIDTFARRLDNHPDFELAECLAQHPPYCGNPAERQVRRRANPGAIWCGIGRRRWHGTATRVLPRRASSP
jgi:N-carbamoyl-L-amino-acid hydrolase